MDDSIFGNEFEIEEYIDKRILEISDLKERKLLKETLSHLFLNLYDHMKHEYLMLEDKIFLELDRDIKRFTIITSIIPREQFDETEESLVPMNEEDKEKREIDVSELTESLRKNMPFFLYTVLFEADYLVIRDMEAEERLFSGVIRTDLGEFKAKFFVVKNEKYYQYIEKLYQIFNANHLPWITVCAPYLSKMFDVYLDSVEHWDEDASIIEVVADFEEYQKYVRYDCIPVWNISTYVEKSSSYPEPCVDKIHFQHIIFRHRLQEDMDYMVGTLEVPIMNIRRVKGDLLITCQEEYPVKWLLYRICRRSSKKTVCPAFNNKIMDDFSDTMSSHYKSIIKTKAELERFIVSMGYSHIMKYVNSDLMNEAPKDIETYNMDYFIEDEFRTGAYRQVLMVDFSAADMDYYMNRDIMSYIITQLQKVFPEFRCLGRIV